eukprot:scaffold239858_cov90-Attheya_sp.AAC.1
MGQTDQPIQHERPCRKFSVSGCGYETGQSLPMLRPAELTEDWKIGSRRGVFFWRRANWLVCID